MVSLGVGFVVGGEPFGYPVDEGVGRMRCAECRVWLPYDLGRCLGVALRGGFGMFFDDLMYEPDVMTVWLCHACAKLLLRKFRGLGGLLEGGEHPSDMSNALCCEWGYVPESVTVDELADKWVEYALEMIDEDAAREQAKKWSCSTVAAPLTVAELKEAFRRSWRVGYVRDDDAADEMYADWPPFKDG